MKKLSRSSIIFIILFGYIILQFIWWEVLLVRQTGKIVEKDQALVELSSTDAGLIQSKVEDLHHTKTMKVFMIVGEGTVFLLLLLFGIYKIRQAAAREQELNNQQKNFFLSITHELKTPIAATKLQLQTIQKHQLAETQRNELIHNALNETERLNTLIDNLLLANRLDSGEFSFKMEQENLSELVNNILNRYYKNEISQGIIKVNIKDNIFFRFDKTAFPSIITNLVDNALKYSTGSKNIAVALGMKENEINLSVSDNGVGISDEYKKKVFDKFFRVGNEDTRTAKGTGLGLYIVNYLVEKHGGTVHIKNNKPQGSIFDITFNA